MFDIELAWNIAQILQTMLKKLQDFGGAEDGARQILQRDIEQRKTLEPDLGSDRLKSDTISHEDSIRAREYRPIFDYETSPENPLLKLNSQNLTVDTIFDVSVDVRGSEITSTIRSQQTKLPNDMSTPALTQRMNNYLADYLTVDKPDIDKYF